MNTFATHFSHALLALVFMFGVAMIATPALSSEWIDPNPTTVSFTLYKYVIGDQYPDGEHPSIPDFTFHLSGPINTSMKSGETIELPPGTYILTETSPQGFVLQKWGGDCDEASGTTDSEDSELVVDEDLVSTNVNLSCQVYNEIDENDPPQINGTLVVNKYVINNSGGTAATSSFSFQVNGDTPIAFEADGSNALSVPVGSYTVTEVTATGYTPSYSGCSQISVTSGNTSTCNITNDDVIPSATGTLIVNKVVINDNGGIGTTSNFSFQVNGGTATAFEADGSNILTLATGTYFVTEVAAAGYTTTYSGCTSVAVLANAINTCTITNDDVQGGNGTTTLYKVEGYVWHDTDKDGVFDEGESGLPGWDVVIADADQPEPPEGEDVILYDVTVSGDGGYYSFLVPEGTWLIAEELKDQWELTYPLGESEGVHTVTVPTEVTVNPLAQIFALFVSTAHAQAPQVFGPFNFGNFFNGCTSNCGGDGGGGGNGGGGGSGKKISLGGGGSNNDDDDEDEPEGEVAGAVAPIGAVNAGMGGAAGAGSLVTTLMHTLMLLLGLAISAATGRRIA